MGAGTKPEAFNIEDISNVWTQVPQIDARAFVEFVWAHTNINKEQKISFLHSVLTDSRNSLDAENRAAQLLSDELKADYNPAFDFSKIEAKWLERSSTNLASTNSVKNIGRKAP